MSLGTKALASVGGKAVGPVGYGLMGQWYQHTDVNKARSTLNAKGLTMPWAPVEYPRAAEIMKTALEQGANF